MEQTVGQHLDATLSNLATKQDLDNLRSELRRDMAELPFATKQDLSDLRSELKQDMAGLRTELKQDMIELRNEMTDIVRSVAKDIVQVINKNTENLRNDLNKVGVRVKTTGRQNVSR
jgi:gas vesicle protein